MGTHSGEVDASPGEFDEEEHIQGLQPHGLHGEKIAGEDSRGLLGKDLPPRGTAPARRGRGRHGRTEPVPGARRRRAR
jgi:hypothetical protein